MQLVNVTKIEYWFLVLFIWVAAFVYFSISFFKLWRERKSEKKLNSIKNYKNINYLVRFGINSFVIILILLLVSLIIFRPVFGVEQSESSTKNLDIAILVDVSLSMNVEDYNNNQSRLVGAKEVLSKILKEDQGNRYSLISFHSKAEVEMPLTFDKNTALTGIDTLRIVESYASSGTRIQDAFVQAKERLINEDDKFGQNRKKIIILVGDGEQIGKDTEDLSKSIDDLTSSNIRIFTLGIGTTTGDKIPQFSFDDGSKSYVYFDGEYPISKLDENNLKSIATEGKGKYFNGNSNFNPSELITELENASQYVDISQGNPIYKDSYFIFTPIILLLLAYLHIEPHNFVMQLRKKK